MTKFNVGDIVRMKSIEEIQALTLGSNTNLIKFCGCEGTVTKVDSARLWVISVTIRHKVGDKACTESPPGLNPARFVLVKSMDEILREAAEEVYDDIRKYIEDFGEGFKMPDATHCSRAVLIERIYKAIQACR